MKKLYVYRIILTWIVTLAPEEAFSPKFSFASKLADGSALRADWKFIIGTCGMRAVS